DLSGRALALCAALAFTACSSAVVRPPANNLAGPGLFTATVRVTNTSATCAWVTIYFATFYKPWIIAGLPNNRPRFVHKGGFYDFGDIIFEQLIPPATIPGEIKVRAEFTKNADCTGGTIADESAQNKGILPDGGTLGLYASVYSTLSGSSGRYSVSTPQHQQ
ncbi:MAG TPA: hypothetical protein VGN11_07595, partial [Candidatus Baltobacteraceae bacterium]|nr:hypothetical protein [Candidatus Baltobacteraceae bacterium]